MWFMKHITNPLVRLVLKSRFHSLMSASVLLFLYRGRRSGRAYLLPVQYVQNGETIYIVPGNPEQKTWWRNLRGGAPVQVILRGRTLGGRADLLQGEEHRAVIADAMGLYLRRFPSSARMRKVRIEPDGTCHPGDLQKVAGSTLLVRVKLDTDIPSKGNR